MLVVTREALELEDCFGLARAAGLEELGTWGAQGGPTRRVSGFRDRVPLELIWWSRDYAEAQIDALLAGVMHSTADALAHGISLRTSGRLAAWQERLRAYPPDLAAAQIEEAALPWGGFTPAGLLTLIRPGDRLALTEWIFDGAIRVLTIVFALNRVWQPTTKRLAERVAPLRIKPDRLAERIEQALTESDPRRALLRHDRAAARHRPARAERAKRRPCAHLACRGSGGPALRRVSTLNEARLRTTGLRALP